MYDDPYFYDGSDPEFYEVEFGDILRPVPTYQRPKPKKRTPVMSQQEMFEADLEMWHKMSAKDKVLYVWNCSKGILLIIGILLFDYFSGIKIIWNILYFAYLFLALFLYCFGIDIFPPDF